MKKIYLTSIAITIGLGVLFPWLVYKLFGFFWNYASVQEEYVDLAALIVLLTLLLTAGVIGLSKYGKNAINFSETVKSKILSSKAVEHLFLFTIVINLINAIKIGDFSALINGHANGSFISYLQLFFDIRILYYLALLKAYKRKRIGKILFYSMMYVGISIMYSSRSGLFWMVFFNVSLIMGMKISKSLKSKIILLIFVAVMLAPGLFAVATMSRGGALNTVEYMAKQIVARLSYIEVSGIELEQYKEKTYEKDIFLDKYGVKNQIEQAINSLLPGDVFEPDVQPNQYWRAVFAGWTVEAVREHYTSMYMVLPMYFYLKYGGLFGVVLCVIFCYVLFRCVCKIKDSAVASFMACYLFYTIFQYFDWAYHIRDLTCFVLTIIIIRIYDKILKKVRFGRYYFYEKVDGIGCNTSI